MTKDRALRVLDVYASANGSGQCTQDEFEEAKKMAIEALESQDRQVIIAGSYLLEGEDNVPDTNVGDIISRQAAIDAIMKKPAWHGSDGSYYHSSDIRQALESLPSAQPEQRWIPCSEGLPEDLEEVNVTWVNHDPEPYYDFVKDKPFTATAVYYKEKWYWYSSTCADILAEYGRNPNEEIDDGIEIIAWMPLPEPWKEKPNEIH